MICTLQRHAKIIIKVGSGMSGTVISAAGYIEIGSKVICGTNLTTTDTNWHHVKRSQENKGPLQPAPVIIGSNVLLGLNIIVLKGVTIGDNTVIAAISVVTKDIPRNVIAAGQPAKFVKYL
jgi:acetyltransferase-like isoleucine patch superfamily enzyme